MCVCALHNNSKRKYSYNYSKIVTHTYNFILYHDLGPAVTVKVTNVTDIHVFYKKRIFSVSFELETLNKD